MKKHVKSIFFSSILSLSLFSCATPTLTQTQNTVSSSNSIEKKFKVGAIIDTKSLQDYSSVDNFKVGTKWVYKAKFEGSDSKDESSAIPTSLLSSLYNFNISLEIVNLTSEELKLKAAMSFPNNPNAGEQIIERTFNKKEFLQFDSVDSSTPLNTTAPAPDKDTKVDYKYEGMENITLDSGKTYNAVKISSDLSSVQNITAKGNSWIVKDIGMVKSELMVNSPFPIKYSLQLVDFKN